ncbi:MAG TPA: YkvA family protein [Bacillota bacterium]|nr:YkvA family protein [Bacillota bacterium]
MKKLLILFKTQFERFKAKAKDLKKELQVIYLAYKRPDVPWYAKLVAALVVGYALSPIDLIPDFVPVLGYLDDLIIIPFGISLVIKLIPQNILAECRAQADEVFKAGKPKNWIAGAFIIGLWILIAGYLLYKMIDIFF